jgi:GT2 family glycosyltransferase
MDVSVITPVWNRADLTMAFLYANWGLYASRPEVEFVIVDNGSTDNTPAVIGQFHSMMNGRLIRVRNEKNQGFGPGHNRGVGHASGDIFIFLSNDVQPTGDYVSLIVQALDEEPGALVGPEMLRHDTGWNTFNGQTIGYLAGHCVACKRDTWDLLGGWDERYVPCDYEDIDLSYTALHKGVPLLEVPLPLNHLFGQSAQALVSGRHAITLQSQARFKEKWGFD